MKLLISTLPATWLALSLVLPVGAGDTRPQAPAVSIESRVDAVFSRWTSDTPGCAVGVGVKGLTQDRVWDLRFARTAPR